MLGKISKTYDLTEVIKKDTQLKQHLLKEMRAIET